MINEIDEMLKAKESNLESSIKLNRIDSQEDPEIISRQVPAGNNRLIYYSMQLDGIINYINNYLNNVDKITASGDIIPMLVFSYKYQAYPNPNINGTYLIGYLNEIPLYISSFVENAIYAQSPVKEDGTIDYIKINIED